MSIHPADLLAPLLAQDGLSASGLNVQLAVLVLVVSVLGYALVNSVEIAIVGANAIRVRHLAHQGSRGAQAVERLRANQDRFFGSIVLLQNLFVVAASAMAAIIAVEVVGGIGLLVGTIITALVIALLGEVTPKVLAAQATEQYGVFVAVPVEWLVRVLGPLAGVMAAVPSILSRVFLGEKAAVTPAVTEGELRMLIGLSAESGEVAEAEAELLERVFHFHDRRVNEIMVPRTEITWLERGTSVAEFHEVFNHAPRSRFPVFDESIDNVVGIVGIKDVLRALARRKIDLSSPIETCLRPAHFVPESKLIGELLAELREERQQMAIAVDEYGGTAGLVTLEMLLEEMVGLVADELAPAAPEFETIDEHTVQVDAGMSVHEARQELDLAIPDGDYETVAGFVLSQLGRIPKEGEAVTGEDFRMVVAEVRGVKIERVVVTKT
jgi:putative hemolysin